MRSLSASRKSQAQKASPATTALLLVDGARLTRECLTSLIAASAPDFNVYSIVGSQDLARVPIERPDIIVYNATSTGVSDVRIRQELTRLSELLPGVSLLVICEKNDEGQDWRSAPPALRGFLPASLNVADVIAAVRVVLASGASISFETSE